MGQGTRLHDTPEDWSSLMGLPTDWDKKNLTNLINNFKKEKFTVHGKLLTGSQLIAVTVQTAKKKEEASTNVFNKDTGVRDKDSGYRVDMSIPTVLMDRILQAYPVILRDDRQYAWFCKNFGGMFAVRERIGGK